mgnify:CR=1 FL=1
MVVEESVGMVSFFRGKRLSLGAQFEHQVKSRIENMAYENILAMMQKLAHKVVLAFKENRKFYNITGNAYTSFYSSVYYKGKMVYMVRSAKGEKSPTRVTLAEGEAYNLPYYYGGDAVDKGKPYVGRDGGGRQWGPNLVYGRIGKVKSTGKDWALVAICPVEYAIFNKDNRIFETVYETYEEFPDLFDLCVIEVKQSTINKL